MVEAADLVGTKGEAEDVPQHVTADAYRSPAYPIEQTINSSVY